MKKFFVRLLVICLVFVVSGCLIWFGGLTFLQKYTPYKDEVVILTSSTITDDKGTFTIAHIGSEVPKPSLLLLPGKTMVTVPDGYGEYELGAILPLLNLEGKTEVYKRAVFSRILGVPVSAFFALPKPVVASDDFVQLRRVLRQTALTKLKQFELPWQEAALFPLLQLNPADAQATSLAEAQFRLQAALVRLVSRSELACTLAIVNTTEESGLAHQLATVLEQSGVRVVRTTDTAELREQSQLISDASRSECAWIVPLVQAWFFTPLEQKPSSEVTNEYRAWGVVFIGADAH